MSEVPLKRCYGTGSDRSSKFSSRRDGSNHVSLQRFVPTRVVLSLNGEVLPPNGVLPFNEVLLLLNVGEEFGHDADGHRCSRFANYEPVQSGTSV